MKRTPKKNKNKIHQKNLNTGGHLENWNYKCRVKIVMETEKQVMNPTTPHMHNVNTQTVKQKKRTKNFNKKGLINIPEETESSPIIVGNFERNNDKIRRGIFKNT